VLDFNIIIVNDFEDKMGKVGGKWINVVLIEKLLIKISRVILQKSPFKESCSDSL
jgi:hypothetical protein